AMLGLGVFTFMPAGLAKTLFPAPAKENVIEALLNMPAPPPPNPLEHATSHDENFYDPKNPPPDDAPIEDLIDYWIHQSSNYRGALYFTPRPSEKALERLFGEAERNPGLIGQITRVLPDDKRTADLVKELYDRTINDGSLEREERNGLKD